MSSILDTSTLYSTYGQSLDTASTSQLESSVSSISSDSTDEELLSVCQDFESYLVQQILDEAISSTKDEDEDEGEYMEYFGDLLTEQYADAIVESETNGLAQQLYESLKTSYSL